MLNYSSVFRICLQIRFIQSLAWEYQWKLLKQIKQWTFYYFSSVSFSSDSVDNLLELKILSPIWLAGMFSTLIDGLAFHMDLSCMFGLYVARRLMLVLTPEVRVRFFFLRETDTFSWFKNTGFLSTKICRFKYQDFILLLCTFDTEHFCLNFQKREELRHKSFFYIH